MKKKEDTRPKKIGKWLIPMEEVRVAEPIKYDKKGNVSVLKVVLLLGETFRLDEKEAIDEFMKYWD